MNYNHAISCFVYFLLFIWLEIAVWIYVVLTYPIKSGAKNVPKCLETARR